MAYVLEPGNRMDTPLASLQAILHPIGSEKASLFVRVYR